jgi:hypothetical protein
MLDKASYFYGHMRQVHMDFHMPEFPVHAIDNFDPDKFVAELVRGRINMIALFAKCHFGNSFYNTRAGHKHSGLEADFLRETAERCRRAGIFTYAYYSLCTDVRGYREHENWRYVDAEGKYSGINGPWARVCQNTPYKEELVLPQLEEVIADYPIDALWIDIPFPSRDDACHCPSCRAKFRTMYGRDLAAAPRVERLAFSQMMMGRFIREVKLLVHKHGKDIKVATNATGSMDKARCFSHENDILVWESQPREGYLRHSYVCRYVRTLEIPCQVMSVRFYHGWGDLTLKPAAQMTSEFAVMIANGCAATSGDQVNCDGSLQPAVYDMFDESFGFVQEREAILRPGVSVTDTALLAAVPSPDLPAPATEGDELQGAHKMLLESHVQFDIVASIDTHLYDRYRTIILPEPNDYGADAINKLRHWVEAGGTLIAVGTSLVRGGTMELQDVLGLAYIEPSVFSVSHFRPHPGVRGEACNIELQCRETTQKVVATTAETIADYIFPQGESIPERAFRNPDAAPPREEKSIYPFATLNRFGKGRAVYIAGSVFRAYWKYNHHWLRQFVDGVIRHLDPDPLYTIDAPATVEANLMKTDTGDLLLNLVDYQVGHQSSRAAIPSIERLYPRCRTACRIKASGVRRVVLEPQGTHIPFESSGGTIRFTIPEFTLLAIVRIAFS